MTAIRWIVLVDVENVFLAATTDAVAVDRVCRHAVPVSREQELGRQRFQRFVIAPGVIVLDRVRFDDEIRLFLLRQILDEEEFGFVLECVHTQRFRWVAVGDRFLPVAVLLEPAVGLQLERTQLEIQYGAVLFVDFEWKLTDVLRLGVVGVVG